jgi:ribosomal protein S18 acetylase RimI-like enzyme
MKNNFESTCKSEDWKIIYSYLKENGNLFIPALEPRIDIELYAQKIAAQAQQFWLKVEDNIIGFAACYLNDQEKGIGYITSISIVQDYQGKGAGSYLLKEIIRVARNSNFKNIRLEVFEENVNAVEFYKLKNFELVEQRGDKLLLNLNIEGHG